MPPARNLFYITPARDRTFARDHNSACDLTPWPLHVAFIQLNSIREVELIEHPFTILPKAQLLWSAENP